MSETGWVIEIDSAAGLLYFTADFKWSTDHMLAVRYARQLDAERVHAYLRQPGSRVTEHMWCP